MGEYCDGGNSSVKQHPQPTELIGLPSRHRQAFLGEELGKTGVGATNRKMTDSFFSKGCDNNLRKVFCAEPRLHSRDTTKRA